MESPLCQHPHLTGNKGRRTLGTEERVTQNELEGRDAPNGEAVPVSQHLGDGGRRVEAQDQPVLQKGAFLDKTKQRRKKIHV